MDRIEIIKQRFSELFEDIATLCCLTEEIWRVMDVGQDPLHLPFGYRPPEWNHEENAYVTFFSADIINLTTENQPDDRFAAYLTVICHHLHYHIIFDDVPEERVEHAIDETVYDLAPGSLALMNDVQMAYLDHIQEHK
jgi:hypothetical protein